MCLSVLLLQSLLTEPTLAVYRRLYSVVFFTYFIMYILQYWNAGSAEWRSAGLATTDYDKCLSALRRHQEMTDYSVRFRILLPSADPLSGLTDEEYAQSTCPV